MNRNYFHTALLMLSKRKLYTFINAFGLSISMGTGLFIFLFILDERSFDKFHVNKNVIFRMEDRKFNMDNPAAADPYVHSASMPAGLRQALLDEIPEIVNATRFNSGYRSVLRYEDKIFSEPITYVDRDFFSMFSHHFVHKAQGSWCA